MKISHKKTLKSWESKWGFTKDMYKEMYDGQNEEATEEKTPKAAFPETTQKEYGWRKPDPLYVALSASSKPKVCTR